MTPEIILKEAQEAEDYLVRTRREIHRNPETGFDLGNTVAYVKAELKGMGISPVECGKAGITAVIGGKKPGKTIMLRADMDALPIKEQSGAEYAATNGNMHACGHDMHTAMLLGAARILKAHEDEICGTVKLMFQPAEEIFEGARDMISDGLLKNPTPDCAVMIHVMAALPLKSGTVICCAPGVSAPAADYFTIRVSGKGCHGSMPDTGVDPISAAAHIIIALQELNARELSLGERAVLTIGAVHGGKAANAIPDCVTLDGSLRTFDEKTRSFLKERLIGISECTAKAFRAEACVNFGSGCPVLFNDKQMCSSVGGYMKEIFGSDALLAGEISGGEISGAAGSEDFAHISQLVPSVMLALAAGEPQKGYVHPQHHPEVMFDENVLKVGCAAYAYTALRYLEEHK